MLFRKLLRCSRKINCQKANNCSRMTVVMKNDFKIIFICWAIAALASASSLFFSEVMEFPPCVLCWYQRIAMYPLVITLWVGATKSNKEVFSFSFPFVVIGWLIAFYHNLLHWEIVPEESSPCLEGVSCSTVYIELFGFLTIPLMSLIAFSLLAFLLLFLKKVQHYER